MTLNGFLSLAWQSVVAPRDVARLLMAMTLGREALLTAFALVVVLNALVFKASLILSPGSVGVLDNPGVFVALQASALAASIAALTLIGRWSGGAGRWDQIAVLLIWLQALRVAVQVVLLALLPISPALGVFLVLAASAAGVWILLNFVAEAHGFETLAKALLVLILTALALTFALSTLMALTGLTPTGLNGHV